MFAVIILIVVRLNNDPGFSENFIVIVVVLIEVGIVDINWN